MPFRSRWRQPAQQQGRRMPELSFEIPTTTRRCLVSMCLAPSTQQIHSLRARGVISFQAVRAVASAVNALHKSAGKLCTVPLRISSLLI